MKKHKPEPLSRNHPVRGESPSQGTHPEYFNYDYKDNYSENAKGEGFRAYQDFYDSSFVEEDFARQKMGPHAGKGPKDYRRSDERIREDVCEILSHHADIDATNIEVKVANGVVNLKGTIESRQIKRMSELVIEHLAGVEDIQNDLRIDTTLASRSITHARPKIR